MRAVLPLALLLLAASAQAQRLLYELVSPNVELGGEFGKALATVPDLDGDGKDDFLVGAPGDGDFRGRAYVFSSIDGALVHELRSPLDEFGGAFGRAVSGVPDVNEDGRGDLLVGAYGEDPGSSPTGAGRAYLFSGATGALLCSLVSPEEYFLGFFGYAVAGVKDVNGDGDGDLVVGAIGEDPGQNPPDAGRGHVFSGAGSCGLLYTLHSPNLGDSRYFGRALAGTADFDGDAVKDFLIGASDDPAPVPGGRVYLISGASGTLIREFASPAGEPASTFGDAVAPVADVDGDGLPDVLVGAPSENLRGRSYLFSGGSGALLYTLVPEGSEHYDFGSAVADAGDMDDDGRHDLLIGAYYTTLKEEGEGAAYVFSGATGGLLQRITSPQPDSVGTFGFAVQGLPDYDGDGRTDIAIGAPFEDGGAEDAGRVYVFSGVVGTAVEDASPAPPAMEAARPNPFTSRTALSFVTRQPGAVRLAVYDPLGREVAVLVNEMRGAERHEVVFDARRLPGGVYLARLEARGVTAAQRLVLVR